RCRAERIWRLPTLRHETRAQTVRVRFVDHVLRRHETEAPAPRTAKPRTDEIALLLIDDTDDAGDIGERVLGHGPNGTSDKFHRVEHGFARLNGFCLLDGFDEAIDFAVETRYHLPGALQHVSLPLQDRSAALFRREVDLARLFSAKIPSDQDFPGSCGS